MNRDLEKQRLATLAERLASATSGGNVRWEVREPNVYAWSSAAGAVSVASRDRDGEPPYEVTVYDFADQKVDALASELLEENQPAPWNDALVELHRVARRSAMRADEVIDALIDSLPWTDEEPDHEHSFLDLRRRLSPLSEERP